MKAKLSKSAAFNNHQEVTRPNFYLIMNIYMEWQNEKRAVEHYYYWEYKWFIPQADFVKAHTYGVNHYVFAKIMWRKSFLLACKLFRPKVPPQT